MGKLLDRLLEGSHVYRIERETDGYMLVSDPECVEEFSALVREAAQCAGDDFVVFTTSDGPSRYVQMYVMPLADILP
ncbi:hypothetical protein ABC365_04590 [Brevundimonas sp. 3P9-tot-E]|jgi:hypothetical protein|uniref:hypothetical protein n=1 Tax=unclassified Brevundimonas TaxID=2622653 RepID=UPI000EEB0BA7|nr:hypothetical protein [Brevundimonas diminuta]HAC01197.1 hypothetical protein [Brevundimonas sp.]